MPNRDLRLFATDCKSVMENWICNEDRSPQRHERGFQGPCLPAVREFKKLAFAFRGLPTFSWSLNSPADKWHHVE